MSQFTNATRFSRDMGAVLRKIHGCALAAAFCMTGGFASITSSTAEASDPLPSVIRIGYAISKTGPYAGGATTTTLPNYELWVKEVNDAGGLKVGEQRIPIEIVEYDDRSTSEDAVRAVERLINQDKVHFVLPPWGTALNLAIGPVLDRAGHLHIPGTATTNRAVQLRDRWERAFFFSPQSPDYMGSLVDLLTQMRDEGKIGNRIAIANVADSFGIELAAAARDLLKASKFEIVFDQSYPGGSQDLQSVINGARRASPDAFLGMSYPADTVALTAQAQTLGFNPKVFMLAVGPQLPIYLNRFGENVEGVISLVGYNFDDPVVQDYIARHEKVTGKSPDWGFSLTTYATLQVLQQAIERTGSLDHGVLAREMQTGSFETVWGTITLNDRFMRGHYLTGQWQDGKFHAVGPLDKPGVRPVVVPKPEWK